MTDAVAEANQISGTAPLYGRPEPLNPEQHGKLGVKRLETPFSFVARQHFLPLLVGEFSVAALSYPIIFAGETKAPVAVMGINPGENLYVNEKGELRHDAYLIAYIRRYPFVVANDEALGRLVVCIDRNAEAVTEDHDFPFFKDGQPTEYTQNCINFCQGFENDRAVTDNFVKTLTELDLLEQREAKFTPTGPDGQQGEPQLIASFFAVSEEKLSKLPAEKLAELRDNGMLIFIYAHLISLWGWDRLIAMAMNRRAQEAAAAANNA